MNDPHEEDIRDVRSPPCASRPPGRGLDGWLLYDFRGLNVLARRVLRFPADAHATRRWFYFVPASGQPRKLVHRIESGVLDAYPGDRTVYLRWQELESGIDALVKGCKQVAIREAVDMSQFQPCAVAIFTSAS